MVCGSIIDSNSICELRYGFRMIIDMRIVKVPAVSDYSHAEHDILWPHQDFCDDRGKPNLGKLKYISIWLKSINSDMPYTHIIALSQMQLLMNL